MARHLPVDSRHSFIMTSSEEYLQTHYPVPILPRNPILTTDVQHAIQTTASQRPAITYAFALPRQGITVNTKLWEGPIVHFEKHDEEIELEVEEIYILVTIKQQRETTRTVSFRKVREAWAFVRVEVARMGINVPPEVKAYIECMFDLDGSTF